MKRKPAARIVRKKTAAKKAVAKKAVAKKTAAKKAAAKSTAAKKTAAKRPFAKKAAAKKRTTADAAQVPPIQALMAGGTRALGIPLDPSWQAAVAFNLRLILSHAATVDGFSLPDDIEPAPIFHA